ncbi:unannotated protein [freshwater metagenome]|uniref:Unannotated protein n=1 Tax=freshwater metagenome TaxID=449393 RepID=A0A6J6ULQ6_9ZZZZ
MERATRINEGGSARPVNSFRVSSKITIMVSDAVKATASPPRAKLNPAESTNNTRAKLHARRLPLSSCPDNNTMHEPIPTESTALSSTSGKGEISSSSNKVRALMAGTALSMVSTPTMVVSRATTRTKPDRRTAATCAPANALVGNGAVGTSEDLRLVPC